MAERRTDYTPDELRAIAATITQGGVPAKEEAPEGVFHHRGGADAFGPIFVSPKVARAIAFCAMTVSASKERYLAVFAAAGLRTFGQDPEDFFEQLPAAISLMQKYIEDDATGEIIVFPRHAAVLSLAVRLIAEEEDRG